MVDGPSGAGRGQRSVDCLSRTQQRLGWDAGVVGALAGHEFALDDRDAESSRGERAGAVFARCAGAEHDHVVVAIHLSLLT